MNEDTILVEVAADGRIVTFAGEDMPHDTLPGLRLKFGDAPIAVPNTSGNRRKIRSGDLRIAESRQLSPAPLPSTPEHPALSKFDGEVTPVPSTPPTPSTK